MIKSNILFLCTGNSRRIQMMEGFLRTLAGEDFEVVSTGSEETPLDPDAVAAMREVGIDISGQELGGRFAVSDVVVRGEVPSEVRRSMEMWVGCIAGALEEMDYVKKLAKAGFDAIDVEATRVYSIEDARQFLAGEGLDIDAIAPQVEGKFISAFVRAVKPASKECCGPTCCS